MGDSRYALIVAGGTGKRLGANIPKQMLPVAGRPILAHTIGRFLKSDPDMVVCVVLHASLLPQWAAFCQENFDAQDHSRLHACAGGAERTASVHLGLQYLRDLGLPLSGWVAIHDGVRMFASAEMIGNGFEVAKEKGNAVAGVPVKSSLRMLTKNGSQAIDRSQFFHVQTPQIFQLKDILTCYDEAPEGRYTDDASLAEACGRVIHLFEGSYDNIKITTPEDMEIAEQLLNRVGRKQEE